MSQTIQNRIARGSQQGYAILTVMFFLTLLVLGTIVVAPNVVTDVQRQKEEEMIWRGKQYARGVRLYYTKLHRFPTQLEDLYKPKTGIRFMRQAYKDPMNTADGSWRLIYVGPNGQLIGSLKDRSMTGNPLAAAGASGFRDTDGSKRQLDIWLLQFFCIRQFDGKLDARQHAAKRGTRRAESREWRKSGRLRWHGIASACRFVEHLVDHWWQYHRSGQQDQQEVDHLVRQSQELPPV